MFFPLPDKQLNYIYLFWGSRVLGNLPNLMNNKYKINVHLRVSSIRWHSNVIVPRKSEMQELEESFNYRTEISSKEILDILSLNIVPTLDDPDVAIATTDYKKPVIIRSSKLIAEADATLMEVFVNIASSLN